MRVFMTILSLLLTTGPVVAEITPPAGGWLNSLTADCRLAFGNSDGGAWFWTERTGTRYLRGVATMPAGVEVWELHEVGAEVVLVLRAWQPDMDGVAHDYLLRLPRDPVTWFVPEDLDFDGDVDQSDFGLKQREGPVPSDWLRAMTGVK
jgi:hypothetical protein